MANNHPFPNIVHHSISITGEPCCSMAGPPTRRKEDVSEFISRYRHPRNTGQLIRTGCISCLNDGVRCDGTNPRCKKASITTEWRINHDLVWSSQGTWRERRGVHTFIDFAFAPQRTGLFESTFWHRIVIQACFQNEAVFHVASAIGALQEHISQRDSSSGHFDSTGLSFALYQCNRAINILVASTTDAEGEEKDPGILLITCVLFAIFEGLHGDTDQALFHSLQARKLLRNCESLNASGRGSRLIDSLAVQPVIGGLEVQAKAIQGEKMYRLGPTIIRSLPAVDQIHSLDHANATLHHGYINLLIFCQMVCLADPPEVIAAKTEEKRALFVPWFMQWERAFVDYLWREASSLTPQDMQRAKVLKASHIAANLLAKIDQGAGRDAWLPYDSDCKAIIDLSASVLSTHNIQSHHTLSAFHFPFLTFGLWVAEPLFIVMSRCPNPELRRQAAGLLRVQPRGNNAQQVFMKKLGQVSNAMKVGHRDTDEWDMDQWIEWAMRTRLDTAMATYFSRLPSEFIEKPSYSYKNA